MSPVWPTSSAAAAMSARRDFRSTARWRRRRKKFWRGCVPSWESNQLRPLSNKSLMVETRQRLHETLLIGVFCGFFFFYGLSAVGLLGADEPRYAQVAREMLARNDWVTPTLWSKLWLEKPPLFYWSVMI